MCSLAEAAWLGLQSKERSSALPCSCNCGKYEVYLLSVRPAEKGEGQRRAVSVSFNCLGPLFSMSHAINQIVQNLSVSVSVSVLASVSSGSVQDMLPINFAMCVPKYKAIRPVVMPQQSHQDQHQNTWDPELGMLQQCLELYCNAYYLSVGGKQTISMWPSHMQEQTPTDAASLLWGYPLHTSLQLCMIAVVWMLWQAVGSHRRVC